MEITDAVVRAVLAGGMRCYLEGKSELTLESLRQIYGLTTRRSQQKNYILNYANSPSILRSPLQTLFKGLLTCVRKLNLLPMKKRQK